MAGALTLSGFALYAVVLGLVPLLVERGVTGPTGVVDRWGPRDYGPPFVGLALASTGAAVLARLAAPPTGPDGDRSATEAAGTRGGRPPERSR